MTRTRIVNKAGLIAAALGVQAVVLSAGWFVTFRIVQRSFARVIQDRTIDQNRDIAERVAALFPAAGGGMVEFGSPEWERLQSIIETDALQELPAGGFACLIEPDGQVLCHPEIRDAPNLRDFSFGGKDLRDGVEADAEGVDLLAASAGGDAGGTASGVIEFTAGDFHYVATQPLAGSDLRLLVHQPVGALVSVSRENTRWVMGVAGVAIVGVLGVTGVGLGVLLRRYDSVHEALNKQLRANLEVARSIQLRSLPRALPSPQGYAVAGWSEPADETGGDTFDVFALPSEAGRACSIDRDAELPSGDGAGGCVAFLLADATGHGIGPALAVTQLNAMARLAWRMGGSLLDVARLVNTELDARLPDGRFVTAVFGVLDTATDRLEIVSAGQGPLLVWRDADASVEEIPSDTYPLGVMDDLGVSATRRVALGPGDAFCAISDGIFEAMDASNEQFGTGRVAGVLREHQGADLDTLARAIGTEADAFTGGAPPADDRTVLLIRRDRRV
jgi:serine phosphatase RsbU (regulator of sigma subunit)